MNTIAPVRHPGGTADALTLSPAELRVITNAALDLGQAIARFERSRTDQTCRALLAAAQRAHDINHRHRAVLVSDHDTLHHLADTARLEIAALANRNR